MDAVTKRIAVDRLKKENLTFAGPHICCDNCGDPLTEDWECYANQIQSPDFFEQLVDDLASSDYVETVRVADGSVKFFCSISCEEDYKQP